MDTAISLGLAVLMLAIVVVLNTRARRRKVDIDPDDPHILRVGQERFRLDWAIGRLVDHSEDVETSSKAAWTTPIKAWAPFDDTSRSAGGGTAFVPSPTVTRRHSRFALVGADQRQEFVLDSIDTRSFGEYLNQRLIILWMSAGNEHSYVRFHSYDARAPLRIRTGYWQLIERRIREPRWTALLAAAGGWILASTLGLWGILGAALGFAGWFFLYGLRTPPNKVFEREHLDPLIERLGKEGV